MVSFPLRIDPRPIWALGTFWTLWWLLVSKNAEIPCFETQHFLHKIELNQMDTSEIKWRSGRDSNPRPPA